MCLTGCTAVCISESLGLIHVNNKPIMSISIKRITDSSPEAIEPLARVLADGFLSGYVTQIVVGGDYDLLLARMRMRIYEGVKDLEVYTATLDGDSTPGAVMIIAAPDITWGET